MVISRGTLATIAVLLYIIILSSQAYVEARQVKGENNHQDDKEIRKVSSSLAENKGKDVLNPSFASFASAKNSNDKSSINYKSDINHFIDMLNDLYRTEDTETHIEVTPALLNLIMQEISSESHYTFTPIELCKKIKNFKDLPANSPALIGLLKKCLKGDNNFKDLPANSYVTQEISTESHHEITPEDFRKKFKNLPVHP